MAMEAKVVAAPTTAERVLEVAEEMFAERGYDASSLGEIAARVGIRPPSLYNHFASKRELYVAVLERLLDPFMSVLGEFLSQSVTQRRVEEAVAAAVRHHLAYPNLARLVQHAALARGPQLELLLQRWYDRIFTEVTRVVSSSNPALGEPDLMRARTVITAFNCMILGYVTLAPLHHRFLGEDPLASPAIDRYIDLLCELSRSVWGDA